MSTLSFIDQFVRCFVPAPFIQLARTAQWLRRQGKIDAFESLLQVSMDESAKYWANL